MNTDSDQEKRESNVKLVRSITGCVAIGVVAFIAILCILIVLLLIYGWQLVYMI